jgi:hypothetical protein
MLWSETQLKIGFLEIWGSHSGDGNWTQARDGRLSQEQNNAKVNCKLHSQ